MKIRLLCPLIIIALNLTVGVLSQDETKPEPIDPTTVSAGPFISWLSDSSLQIDYVCHGEPQHDTVTIDSQAIIPHHCLSSLPGDLIINRNASIPSETHFANVSPLLAVSDIHGEFAYLISFLKQNLVIDDSLNWQWGEGHLVFNGDIFDRGDKVFETLWLIYRLQEQAFRAGGMVHLIMGNHELMVLRGDERYLNPVYTDVVIPLLGTTHQELVGQNSILGDWLRTLPTMIVIDSLLFVHGGISMELIHAGITIDQINQASRQYLDLTSDSLKADSLASLLYNAQGPFWNRTMVWEYNQPQMTPPQLDSVLGYFEVRAVVVGHSEHDSLTALFDNHLFAIDIPVEESGGFEGFLLQDNQFYRVTPDGLLHPLVSTIVPPGGSEQ